jgi:hypothetical protein
MTFSSQFLARTTSLCTGVASASELNDSAIAAAALLTLEGLNRPPAPAGYFGRCPRLSPGEQLELSRVGDGIGPASAVVRATTGATDVVRGGSL